MLKHFTFFISVNKVIILGNLGQDPEARFTPQGTAVTNLSVATNESWKNQNGEIQDFLAAKDVIFFTGSLSLPISGFTGL